MATDGLDQTVTVGDSELRMELTWLYAHLRERLDAERAIRIPRAGAEAAEWAKSGLQAVEAWREAPLPEAEAEATDVGQGGDAP